MTLQQSILQSYQQRVVQEKEELNTKIAKLSTFVGAVNFADVPQSEQVRLRMQLKIMQLYGDILFERIEAFGKKGT